MASEPKYREIGKTLRDEIARGVYAPNSQLPSEHELSRRFAVSYMTARQAVAQLVNEGIVRRISGKGTFVLDATESRPARRPLALIVPALWQKLDPYYFPDVLEGFQSEVQEQGREVLLADYSSIENETQLASGSAVACLLTTTAEAKVAEDLKDRGFFVLGINRYTGRRHIPWIAPENMSGTADATERLVQLGHRRVGFIRGDLANLDANDRLNGYRHAMRANGLNPNVAGNGFREGAGYLAARELLESLHPPTAIVTASDLSALGALKAARELGLESPSDLSIVGFGNFSLISYIQPTLTTVDLPRFRLGQRAAEMLLALAHGDTVRTETLATRFVPGGTVAAPRPMTDPGDNPLLTKN
jgi:DNA-binding LacI/PurR family transcriptional regulator